ncbi:hypothetical protein DFH09DRAFT_1077597 [Mycena vulgaris]|nr:hypothetical protein DFH09DRAFT_1077597 [Mycena vulgaris]
MMLIGRSKIGPQLSQSFLVIYITIEDLLSPPDKTRQTSDYLIGRRGPESSTKATQTESGQTACRIKAVQAHQRITDNGRQMNRSLTMVTGDHLKSLVIIGDHR